MRYDLVVLDELGYVVMPDAAAELLFQVIAGRAEGAAIAPAKQRRVRSLLIKLGALAGAGAAVGTVYALSHGSPSRPPGAH